MRKSYDSAFKAKVAIEAVKEQMTLQELAQKYDVSPGQMSQWKRQLLESAGEQFERPNKKRNRERERDQLLKTVGQLKIENDVLKKNTASGTGQSHDGRTKSSGAFRGRAVSAP